MSYSYPQAAFVMNVLFEDFETGSVASDDEVYKFEILTKNLTVRLNDYKTASTFDCEIDYKNFPFDPRIIRSAQVTIHIEDMAMLYDEHGQPVKIKPNIANTIFQGFVDEESIDLDDSKRVVRLSGRDMTALLIDQPYIGAKKFSLGLPLDQNIRNLFASVPALKNLSVVNVSSQNPLPSIASFYPNFGANDKAGYKNVAGHETYWDIVQDVVSKGGLIAYMKLDTLYISDPRTVFREDKAVKFIYGKNVKSLSFKRKLGRHKGFNVVVRSVVGKKVIEAKIPEEATAAWCKGINLPVGKAILTPKLNPDGSPATDTETKAPYLLFLIHKIATHAALVNIGQTVFEELSRQDLEGTMETIDMESHSGDSKTDIPNYEIYDLTTGTSGGLPLTFGQPVSIEIENDDVAGISRFSTPIERQAYLELRGYPTDVAVVFANSVGQMSPTFYTKGIQLTLDQDSGFKMQLSFINYLELTNKNLK